MSAQPRILAPLPPAGRFLSFDLLPSERVAARVALARLAVEPWLALGVGEPLARAWGHSPDGLRAFPALSGPGLAVPSTQGALWAFVAGEDAGEALLRARALARRLGGAFRLVEDVGAFVFAGGRDLTGYEDGTENPKGDAAAAAALVQGRGPGLDGGSFVAVQRWVHDLATFDALPAAARDHVIGRRVKDNVEMEEAGPSAHVKRTAQESFDPPAFVVRRSMPWGDTSAQGLYFVAYGASADPFERILRRMTGAEDGVVDALFLISRPVTGGYYFCPPVDGDGRLDLRALEPSK